jgi:hypothetical protein
MCFCYNEPPPEATETQRRQVEFEFPGQADGLMAKTMMLAKNGQMETARSREQTERLTERFDEI